MKKGLKLSRIRRNPNLYKSVVFACTITILYNPLHSVSPNSNSTRNRSTAFYSTSITSRFATTTVMYHNYRYIIVVLFWSRHTIFVFI